MKLVEVKAESLYSLATEDYARNYFICYTMDNHQNYEKVYMFEDNGEHAIGVFLRKTGIVQMALKTGFNPEPYVAELEQLLASLNWKQINISGRLGELVNQMRFKKIVREGAFIARCTPEHFNAQNSQPILEYRWLTSGDLNEVVELYQKVFKGFASYDYMMAKLDSRKGRAVGGYLEGKLISVAQSDYETDKSALIVGVATDPNYQGKGYGRVCLEKLCEPLIKDGKTLYLQYDSEIAGKLYKTLGFEVIDNILQIERILNEV